MVCVVLFSLFIFHYAILAAYFTSKGEQHGENATKCPAVNWGGVVEKQLK